MERVSVGVSARLTSNPSRLLARHDEHVQFGAAARRPVEALLRTGGEAFDHLRNVEALPGCPNLWVH